MLSFEIQRSRLFLGKLLSVSEASVPSLCPLSLSQPSWTMPPVIATWTWVYNPTPSHWNAVTMPMRIFAHDPLCATMAATLHRLAQFPSCEGIVCRHQLLICSCTISNRRPDDEVSLSLQAVRDTITPPFPMLALALALCSSRCPPGHCLDYARDMLQLELSNRTRSSLVHIECTRSCLPFLRP